MHRLLIEFSSDRNRCGRLTLVDRAGRRICGGFAVAGRSTDSLAAAEGNPRRDTKLLYGDTPTGRYRLARTMKSGKGTFFPTAEFGPHGVVVLEAVAGDAALAEANGRFHVLLQGGRRAANGGLRSSAGALRLANDDLRLLMAALRKADEVTCEVVEADVQPKLGFVFDDKSCPAEDPAPLPREDGSGAIWAGNPSRRAALRAGAAGAAGLMALRLSVAFLALDAARPPSALAYGSSPSGSNTPQETPPAAANPPATPPATSTGAATSPTLDQLQNLNNNGAVPGTQPYIDTPGPGAVQAPSPSDAKTTYFQEMNAAGQIADPTARNAAINAANTKYFSTLNQPAATQLPTTSTTTVTVPALPASGGKTK
jgi:hypothetical protein